MNQSLPIGQSNTPVTTRELLAPSFTVLLIIGLFCWVIVSYGGPGWSLVASNQKPETEAAATIGLFKRMDVAGISSVQRKGERLIVKLGDGSTTEAHVCGWNDEVERQGGCTFFTPGRGRMYLLEAGNTPSYRGDAHQLGESVDYVMGRLKDDLAESERAVERLRKSQASDRVAATTWNASPSKTSTHP